MKKLTAVPFFILFLGGWVAAKAPTDPDAKKAYDHNYEWLSRFPTNFIATNMRGENDRQYPERRQAALDLLREKRDLTTVPELMDELKRASFLSGDICEVFGDWRTKKALPLLREVAADSQRPKEVRQKAEKAIWLISRPVTEAETPAPSRPSY